MNNAKQAKIKEVTELVREARRKLEIDASFRLITLMDMLLFDLGRELASSAAEAPSGDHPSPDGPPARS